PRWVLLVGDASYDGKNYLGLGENDLVPTKVMWTNTFETATDDWLGDVDGDGLADVAVGRLPVRTLQQAQAMVDKIISYEQGMPTSGVLLVADLAAEYDFEVASQAVELSLPAETPVQEVFRSRMDDVTANRAIIDAINRGPKLVNYAGHGSASVWRGNLLTNDSVGLLTNQQALPVVVSMTCLNGLFNDPRSNSLGESLLLSERGGAIAVWASSAQTVAGAQELVDQEMIRQLFSASAAKTDQRLTIGEAIMRAKAIAQDEAVIKSWTLLGDPLLRLR
ncbi:MAG TPA: C25 family cysteine peptidase, partial [Blastocatellia bacterium]|nr:C25 family cysteine peptidase [Blastocatellia bacterium]